MSDLWWNSVTCVVFLSEKCVQNSIVYTGHLLMGLGCLIPWNAFITAADYFEARYPVSHGINPVLGFFPPQICTALVGTWRLMHESAVDRESMPTGCFQCATCQHSL